VHTTPSAAPADQPELDQPVGAVRGWTYFGPLVSLLAATLIVLLAGVGLVFGIFGAGPAHLAVLLLLPAGWLTLVFSRHYLPGELDDEEEVMDEGS
jgi:hypothetical protein